MQRIAIMSKLVLCAYNDVVERIRGILGKRLVGDYLKSCCCALYISAQARTSSVIGRYHYLRLCSVTLCKCDLTHYAAGRRWV